MAYQQVTQPRSTRFPFMGVGAIGCDCQDGLGAVATASTGPKIEVPGLRELDRESLQLYQVANQFLGRAPWNAAVYNRALTKAQTSSGQVELTPIEIVQLVNGAAILVASVQINTKRILGGPHARNLDLQQTIISSVAAARRLVGGVARLLTQVYARIQARGVSGLGVDDSIPIVALSIVAGPIIALLAVVGTEQIKILIDHASIAIIRIETSRVQNSIVVENNRCSRLLAETGQPCTLEQRQQTFEQTIETISENSPLAQMLESLNNLTTGLTNPLTAFSEGISSAIKTVIIIGGVAVVAYVGFAYLLPSYMAKRARSKMTSNRRRR